MGDFINSVSSGSTYQNGQLPGSVNNAEMGKYQFLQILVTQLQNQDPMSPMKSQDFAAQLAQFSSLERLMSIDQTLQQGMDTDMLLAQTIHNTMATNFIGKEVMSYGDTLSLLSGESVPVTFELGADAKKVSIEIYDDNDKLVRTIEVNQLSSGRQTIDWDGKDDDGNSLSGGNYHFKVIATDGEENSVNVQTFSRGIVSAVRYVQGQPVLIVNGKEVVFGDIVQIG
ncbi:MAG: hypothetical protein GXO77_06375 [Calditrichaeota bacterium]|nr:hypothetical protein [Calditrichota bacterium]